MNLIYIIMIVILSIPVFANNVSVETIITNTDGTANTGTYQVNYSVINDTDGEIFFNSSTITTDFNGKFHKFFEYPAFGNNTLRHKWTIGDETTGYVQIGYVPYAINALTLHGLGLDYFAANASLANYLLATDQRFNVSGGWTNSTSQTNTSLEVVIEDNNLTLSADQSIRLYSNERDLFREGNPIELYALTNGSKAYIAWYDEYSNGIGWFGCHNYSLTGGSEHLHCSIETPSDYGDESTIETRFAISYGRGDGNMFAEFVDINKVHLKTGVKLVVNDSDAFFGDDIAVGGEFISNPSAPVHVSEVAQGTVPSLNTGTGVLVQRNDDGGRAAGVAILGGSNGYGFLDFGDASDIDAGRILYTHNGDLMSLKTAGSDAVLLDAQQNMNITGNLTVLGQFLCVDSTCYNITQLNNSASSSGDSFDQSLNTTDNVTFTQICLNDSDTCLNWNKNQWVEISDENKSTLGYLKAYGSLFTTFIELSPNAKMIYGYPGTTNYQVLNTSAGYMDIVVNDTYNGLRINAPTTYFQSRGTSTDYVVGYASDGSQLFRFTETGGGFGWLGLRDSGGNEDIVLRTDGGAMYLTPGTVVTSSINSSDWSNITITESQITDLSHTVETDSIAIGQMNANETAWLLTYNTTYEANNDSLKSYADNTFLTTETDSIAIGQINANESAWLLTFNSTYEDNNASMKAYVDASGGTGQSYPSAVNLTVTTHTGALTNGSFTGYEAGHAICNAEYSGSVMCNEFEVDAWYKFVTNPTTEGQGWVTAGGPKFVPADIPVNDCNGWTHGIAGSYLANYWNLNATTGGDGRAINCGTSLPLVCCTY